MTEEEPAPTRPSNAPPPPSDPAAASEPAHPAVLAAERYAHLVGVLLEPIRQEIKLLRDSVEAVESELADLRADVKELGANVTLKNGEIQNTKDELLAVQQRLAHVERSYASTEPPPEAA